MSRRNSLAVKRQRGAHRLVKDMVLNRYCVNAYNRHRAVPGADWCYPCARQTLIALFIISGHLKGK